MAARNVYRVFAGNLPWTIGKRELKEYFSQFGHVTSAVVMFNKETGMSRGYGFVNFGNKEGYVNATKESTQNLENAMVTVRPADQRKNFIVN